MNDAIPIVETYRGVGIHAFQSTERIDAVVKPAIDAVYGMSSAAALVAYVVDRVHPPEARLFAKARCVALWQLAAENREVRPALSLEMLHVHTAGLDSLHWIDPLRFGTLFDSRYVNGEKRPLRDVPLSDEQCGMA